MIDSQQVIYSDKELILSLAKKIVDRGMAVPAIFFLDMMKYLSFFGGQLMIFFGPIITAFISPNYYYKFAELLEDRKNIEFLLLEIERLETISKNREEEHE
jgi:hypothetical protein|tara:strand:- start:1130 stop:1432 length:303 start_codon:yes stop_codon:yes gene_type:complete